MRGVGLRPKIVMSKTVVDFEDRVVPRDPSRRVPFSDEVTFTNHHLAGITWSLDDSCLRAAAEDAGAEVGASPIFFISPKGGDLAPGDSVTLRVTFSPAESQDYEYKLPLCLEGEKTRPHLTLTLRGCGVFPRLSFDVDEVTLPTVPLGVTSRALFYAINCGYDNLELTYRLPLHVPVQIEVSFPEGKTLGITMERLPVVLSFKSATPVSFATRVEILDTDNNRYAVGVCGSADNCVLTTFPFLQQYGGLYQYHVRDGRPVQLLDKNRVRQLETLEIREKERQRQQRRKSKGGKTDKEGGDGDDDGDKPPPQSAAAARRQAQLESDTPVDDVGVDPRKEPPRVDEEFVAFLVLWLNANVMPTPLTSVPGELVSSNGKLAYVALEAMSGRKVPGRAKKLPNSKNELVQALLAQYAQLLLFLKERGALLNTVRPEQLLNRDQYIRARELEDAKSEDGVRITATQQRERREKWESGFEAMSRDAWVTLLLQGVRIFVLARVTPKSFVSLPGVLLPVARAAKGKDGKDGPPKPAADPELVDSNVYSVSEGIVLKWLGYHVNATTPASALPKRSRTPRRPSGRRAALPPARVDVPALAEDGGMLAATRP